MSTYIAKEMAMRAMKKPKKPMIKKEVKSMAKPMMKKPMPKEMPMDKNKMNEMKKRYM